MSPDIIPGAPHLLLAQDKLKGPLFHGLPLQSNSLGSVLRRAVRPRPAPQDVLPLGAVGGASPERSVPVGDLHGQLGGGRPLGRARRHHTDFSARSSPLGYRGQHRPVPLPGPQAELILPPHHQPARGQSHQPLSLVHLDAPLKLGVGGQEGLPLQAAQLPPGGDGPAGARPDQRAQHPGQQEVPKNPPPAAQFSSFHGPSSSRSSKMVMGSSPMSSTRRTHWASRGTLLTRPSSHHPRPDRLQLGP